MTVPLVSLIMPARNHAAYVATALESLLAQSHPHIELIVIDDGSQDATPAEIARVLAATPRQLRVEFHQQPNQGLGRTLIRALALARGEYVQFLASDDALFPAMTARLVAALAATGPDVAAVACDGYVFDCRVLEGQRQAHRLFSALHPAPVGRNQHREMMVGNWLPAMGLLYRRDILLAEGGFDPDLVYEDWGLLLNLTRRFRILQIPDRLFLYRQHGSNISRDPERMYHAHHALCARHPAMQAVRVWKQALLARDLPGALAGLRPGNLDLATRFALRRLRARIAAGAESPAAQQRAGGRIRIAPGCVIARDAVLEAGPGDLVLGPGCRIGAGARLVAGAGLELGAGCLIGERALVGGAGGVTRLGPAALLAEGAELRAGSDLGAYAVLGPGVVLAGAQPDGHWRLG